MVVYAYSYTNGKTVYYGNGVNSKYSVDYFKSSTCFAMRVCVSVILFPGEVHNRGKPSFEIYLIIRNSRKHII